MTETAKFGLELEKKGTGASELSSELADLRSKIEGDLGALRGMQAALRNLKAASSPNVQVMEQLKAKIDAQKQSIAAVQERYIGLGGTFEKTRKPTGDLKFDLGDLMQQATRLPGPLGAIASKLLNLNSAAGPARVKLLAAAYLAMGAAVAFVTTKLLAYGIAQSGARRSELQRLEGLSKIRDWWGRGHGDPKEMQTSIDRVTDAYAMSRSEVAKYQEELYRAGLRAGALDQALEGIVLTASTQGSQEAQVFKSLALGAAYAGRSIKDMTEDAKARLGDLAARQMLNVDVQARKIRENFARITDGLNLDPLLKGLNMVTSLFSQSEASGRALKSIFTAAFQPMIDSLEKLGPIGKRFFQGMIIAGLLLTIGILKIRNTFRDLFGGEVLKGLDMAQLALWAGAAAALALAFALGAIVIKLAILTAPIWLTVAAIAALFAIGWKLGEYLASTKWGRLAGDMISGLVEGITSGASKVWEAIKKLAVGAKDAFKKALGIASPSKDFRLFGGFLPVGAAIGVDAEAPKLTAAVRGMGEDAKQEGEHALAFKVQPPPIPTGETSGERQQGGREAPPPAQRSGPAIVINNLTLTASGGSTEEQARDLWDQFAEFLEDLGVQVGARGAGGATT